MGQSPRTVQSTVTWPARVAAGHPRLLSAIALGAASWFVIPGGLGHATRGVLAWDVGAIAFLLFAAALFVQAHDARAMGRNAIGQLEGEWTVFFVTLGGVLFSFVALVTEMADVKDLPKAVRNLHIALVGVTLFVSWLVTHVLFAMRYAHEYYTDSGGEAGPDGGLDFPGKEPPDYWDFCYFAITLGMTFQVSDVPITDRKLRRLATVHGLISFLFNATIIALTVNIAASLLG